MSGNRKKVLWVDDEIEFLRSHIMFLETRGYSVVPLFSGEDAVEMIRQSSDEFDIVLLDEQMPGKDGVTTLEEIKEIKPDLPVVMVTKSEEEQLMEAAIGKKIDGYLTKPVNPSQILLVCKKLLDSKQIMSSQIKQRFVRSYSDTRSALANSINAQDWIRMYEKIVRWDLEMDKIDDEGLRQTHAGQKSDCNRVFSNDVIENYGTWIKGINGAPVLSHQAFDKYILPVLSEGRKVILFMLSGMRLDQYCCFEQILSKSYSVKRQYFYALLPSVSSISRNSFFSGLLPRDLASQYPQTLVNGNEFTNDFEKELLLDKLCKNGIKCNGESEWFFKDASVFDSESLVSKVSAASVPLFTIVVDLSESLLGNTSDMLKNFTNNESGYRELTVSWFLRSALLATIKELASGDTTIILTADHGTTLCSRGTELYGVDNWGKNLRYKSGKNISTDERNALFLNDPSHFGLPRGEVDNCCIIARENYYFVPPDKFEFYRKHYKTTFQEGGISMEEIIMPLGIFRPRACIS